MTRAEAFVARFLRPVIRARIKAYYALTGAPSCHSCGNQASVFHVTHEIAIRKPRWLGLPMAILSALFVSMPDAIRCSLCEWMHERNLNA